MKFKNKNTFSPIWMAGSLRFPGVQPRLYWNCCDRHCEVFNARTNRNAKKLYIFVLIFLNDHTQCYGKKWKKWKKWKINGGHDVSKTLEWNWFGEVSRGLVEKETKIRSRQRVGPTLWFIYRTSLLYGPYTLNPRTLVGAVILDRWPHHLLDVSSTGTQIYRNGGYLDRSTCGFNSYCFAVYVSNPDRGELTARLSEGMYYEHTRSDVYICILIFYLQWASAWAIQKIPWRPLKITGNPPYCTVVSSRVG